MLDLAFQRKTLSLQQSGSATDRVTIADMTTFLSVPDRCTPKAVLFWAEQRDRLSMRRGLGK